VRALQPKAFRPLPARGYTFAGQRDSGAAPTVRKEEGGLLTIGTSATASLCVQGNDLATTLNQTAEDAFPAVLATARMIGLMELAASRAMRPALADGEVSVGVNIDVAHTAATPIGVPVSAEARFVGMEGKMFLFEIFARDAGGEIGRGRHRRAVVSAARLLQGATRRCGGGA
jgi:predicted thioesterase